MPQRIHFLERTTLFYHLLVKNQQLFYVLISFLHCHEINSSGFVQLTQEAQHFSIFCRVPIYQQSAASPTPTVHIHCITLKRMLQVFSSLKLIFYFRVITPPYHCIFCTILVFYYPTRITSSPSLPNAPGLVERPLAAAENRLTPFKPTKTTAKVSLLAFLYNV